jgi:hypothetical protein
MTYYRLAQTHIMLGRIHHNWQGLIPLLKCGKHLRNKMSDFLPKYKHEIVTGIYLHYIWVISEED